MFSATIHIQYMHHQVNPRISTFLLLHKIWMHDSLKKVKRLLNINECLSWYHKSVRDPCLGPEIVTIARVRQLHPPLSSLIQFIGIEMSLDTYLLRFGRYWFTYAKTLIDWTSVCAGERLSVLWQRSKNLRRLTHFQTCLIRFLCIWNSEKSCTT